MRITMPVEGTTLFAQAAGMSSPNHSEVAADGSAWLPDVQLEVRQGNQRAMTYALSEVDFLIGSVPGCDLRVAGADTSGVLCLLARHPGGVSLRKLAPTQTLLVNGRSASHLDLSDEDRIQCGLLDVRVRITPACGAAAFHAELEPARRELQDRFLKIRAQVVTLQQEKAELERHRQENLDPLQKALERRTAEMTHEAQRFEEERRQHEQRQQTLEKERAVQLADLQLREQALADRQRDFETKLKQYEDNVLRLDRGQGSLEEREREILHQTEELTRQRERLRSESAELETQLVQIDEWRVKLSDEAERLASQKQTQDTLQRELSERAAVFEGQQGTMALLRGRLERLREEIRGQQQQLDQQHDDQETRETELNHKTQELHRLQLELQGQDRQYEQDRQQWLERSAVMETAVRQLKQAQDSLAVENERLRKGFEDLETRTQKLLESEGILQGRLTQLAETQERMDLERHALQQRSVNLLQREQACASLQEQLHRRAEEIAQRHQELSDQHEAFQTRSAAVEEQQLQLQRREQDGQQQLDSWRQELELKAVALQQQQGELTGFEERYQRQLDQIALLRGTHAQEQEQFRREQEMALEKLARERVEFDTLRQEAQELMRQLPDVELRAGTALERLSDARAQMRDHLSEIHQYVRQCQEELQRVRGRLQVDMDQLQEQEQSLHRSQDEHRLASVAFRQQLIDWQGQIAELKRLLARDETRLGRQQAQVDQQTRAMEAESQRLARHAEDLDQQEREVADRRQEMDRHLVDMREWYRRKLRELAGIPLMPDTLAAMLDPPSGEATPSGQPATAETTAETTAAVEGEEVGMVPTGRSILSITGPIDAGDQKLGQVLREAQLIDADTLTALLAEARRQRRSLRQVLLSSGVITLYQLALMEAGNTPGLVLGPVRVIDRLRHTPHETIYRVFDPRRGTEAVLRHMAESDMTDALRPDEFRQRFTQAMLNDLHVANTLEVFDLLGRPAVLQEWLTGLPARDWPPLTAAPGVCYRLLTQAAQGLATAHRAGLVHGHLSDMLLFLTGEGVLKIQGLGEPPWLIGVHPEEEPTPADDLRTLGKIVSGWCTPSGVRKGARTKPLPDALISVLYRLAADGDAGYHNVQELLQDLEKVASAIPPNAEAWDRLLKYVREHGTSGALLRQSA